MKRLAFLIFALLLASPSWAANWYVSKNGSSSYDGTVPYYTSSNHGPKDTIAHGIALMSKGDHLWIVPTHSWASGTPDNYSETVSPTVASGTAWTAGNYYQMSNYLPSYGEIVITGSSGANASLDLYRNYWWFDHLRFEGNGSGETFPNIDIESGVTQVRLDCCIMRDATHYANLYLNSATYVYLNNCLITGAANNINGVTLTGTASTCYATNTVITGNGKNSGYGVYNNTGCTFTYNQCDIIGNTSNQANNMTGSGTYTATTPNIAAATCIASYAMPPGWLALVMDFGDENKPDLFAALNSYNLYGTWSIQGLLATNVGPFSTTQSVAVSSATSSPPYTATMTGFATAQGSGTYTAGLITNDYVDISGFTGSYTANNQTDVLVTGAYGTYITVQGNSAFTNCSSQSGITASNSNHSMQSVYNGGNEIGYLGYNNANMTYTNAFTIQYSNASATYQCYNSTPGATTGYLRVTKDGSNYTTINLSSYPTLGPVGTSGTLLYYLNSLGYTVALSNASANPQSYALADVESPQSINSAYQATFSAANMVGAEVQMAQSTLQGIVHSWGGSYSGYSCQSGSTAQDQINSSQWNLLYGVGLYCSKGEATATTGDTNFIGAINSIFDIYSAQIDIAGGLISAGNKATTILYTDHQVEYCASTGYLNGIYVEGGYATSSWKTDFQNAFGELGRLVHSGFINAGPLSSLYAAISSTHTPDSYHAGWTHTFADQSNYRLRVQSPLIGAGVAVSGLTLDYYGNPLPYNKSWPVGVAAYRGAVGSW